MTIILKKRFNNPLQAEEQLVESIATKEAEGVDQKTSTGSTGSPEEGKISMESTGSPEKGKSSTGSPEEGVSSSEPLCLSPVPSLMSCRN